MPSPYVSIPGLPADVRAALDALQQRLGLTADFSREVLTEAQEAAKRSADRHVDRTDIEFVTIDPATSRDLDQAIQIERAADGYLVRYAISDVGHFVRPGTELEAETHRRGQTMYAPDARIPLHPAVLSEAAASLLADGIARPAMLWEMRLDSAGNVIDVTLTRSMVRSRAKLNYQGVQADLDAGRAHPSIALLPEVGRLRQQLEIERGGASLNLPDQEIVDHDGRWNLELRGLVPVEDYNAQISLMTGFTAAQVMLEGKTGVLRTLPPAEEWAVAKLRRSVNALGVPWPRDVAYPEFLRGLDPDDPQQLAALTKCTTLFRGAAYLTFDGAVPQENLLHAALAAPYAHTTAPLRRLVDRYVLEICHAQLGGTQIPEWVSRDLEALPDEMAESGRTANAYERGVVDLAEALVLRNRVGDRFPAVVTDVNPKKEQATVQIEDPAIELRLEHSRAIAGDEVTVEVNQVSVADARVSATIVR